MTAKLFDFVGDLSYDKKRLIDSDEENLAAIDQFMINRAFSQHQDTILYANEMNRAAGIDNRMFYDYYFHSIRPRKRFGWAKKGKEKYLAAVQEYFGYGHQKAMEAISVMTEQQLEDLTKLLDKGGRK